MYAANPHVKLVAISYSQAQRKTAPVTAVVHHGLPPERFPFLPYQGYLLYLGRYSREKGPHLAIEIAARAGLPLLMAGEPHEQEYYDETLVPLMRKHGVLDLGPVGGRRKSTLLARARALVFPIQWDEPFGLVMIEAQLCGIPVLTGLLADDPSELISGARVAETFFDRAKIRALARERWSAERMASDYLRVYAQAVAEAQATAPGAGYAG